MIEPFSLGHTSPRVGRNFRWTIVAFVFAGALMAGLMIWQLSELSPDRYCKLAEVTGSENACLSVMLKLLTLKDHALIGTLATLGLTVLALAAVALGVRISATAPGGGGVDVGGNGPPDTSITQGDKEIVIPSPPASE